MISLQDYPLHRDMYSIAVILEPRTFGHFCCNIGVSSFKSEKSIDWTSWEKHAIEGAIHFCIFILGCVKWLCIGYYVKDHTTIEIFCNSLGVCTVLGVCNSFRGVYVDCLLPEL